MATLRERLPPSTEASEKENYLGPNGSLIQLVLVPRTRTCLKGGNLSFLPGNPFPTGLGAAAAADYRHAVQDLGVFRRPALL